MLLIISELNSVKLNSVKFTDSEFIYFIKSMIHRSIHPLSITSSIHQFHGFHWSIRHHDDSSMIHWFNESSTLIQWWISSSSWWIINLMMKLFMIKLLMIHQHILTFLELTIEWSELNSMNCQVFTPGPHPLPFGRDDEAGRAAQGKRSAHAA